MSIQETYPELRIGDTGEWVTYLQQQLAALGYDPGPIDGEFGQLTDAMVRRLQADQGGEQTGVVDQGSWGLLLGSSGGSGTGYGPGDHDPASPSEPTSTATATADQFVELCLAQEGDDYDYGVDVDLEDPDPASFDCAELVEWALAQLGVLDGLKGDWNWSQGQRAAIEAAGLGCSVDEARSIRGALLFNSHHVAVSLGDGVQTIEAMGEQWNVRRGKIDGTSGAARFDGAGRVPGLQY
jgi:peptidoglycan hydrolase-like protein with peptidoglycan-binding domain